ncbi:flagellar brake protein [Geodermatophilus ruber]|uniref:PilZ domain-containing protein n=1 Tax=Geodermatophilus ruber TaxID=504800 RepID=A0A1I4KQY2_9ACTN|nr:PilZ domain-containing protein [Geodermatophilus ruber]SFL80959.1 PilZ domain-containing protein [Geodermatophilus ruber]
MELRGSDRPEEGALVEIVPLMRGVSITSEIEVSDETRMVVRPAFQEYAEKLQVKPTDRVDVLWAGPEGGRSLPAQIGEILDGPEPRWALRIVGPAERSQRRQVVRAHVEIPVRASNGVEVISGQTVDLSEAGARVWFDGWGLPPEPGIRLDVTLELEDASLTASGEVVRMQRRGARWQVSVRFLDVPEKEQDRLRRRVFQALRVERVREAD